jgi:hypothetical protein
MNNLNFSLILFFIKPNYKYSIRPINNMIWLPKNNLRRSPEDESASSSVTTPEAYSNNESSSASESCSSN